MSLFKYLRKKKGSANIAKERLQIIISHEKKQRTGPDYLPTLQREILEVIAKYVDIDKDAVSVNLDRVGGSAVLERNVTVPDEKILSTDNTAKGDESIAG